MIIGQMYSCGLTMVDSDKKAKPIAMKSKAWCNKNYLNIQRLILLLININIKKNNDVK